MDMVTPEENDKNDKNIGSYLRRKTSHRMSYEAQVQVIQKQIGDLEEIREKLGLSQRKICQLLLVDPSAWSRWTKTESAPPHIWRALQWYLALQNQLPGLSPQYFLGGFHSLTDKKITQDMKNSLEQSAQEILSKVETQNAKILKLEKNLQNMKVLSGFLGGLAGLFFFLQWLF